MAGASDILTLTVMACVQCLLIVYGTMTVVAPLLKLRAARKRAAEARDDATGDGQPEGQPQPQLQPV